MRALLVAVMTAASVLVPAAGGPAATSFAATSPVGPSAATSPAASASTSRATSAVTRPTTGVTRDALPTVQIDGVVWSEAVVGTTVYAGGSFANARPAGAAAGTNLTPRANLLAFDLTTGALKTSFAPSLNAQVKSVVASPDGSLIYVGGSFTTADGQTRDHLAAYSTSTGALVPTFAPQVDATVNSIAVTADTVYAGGGFSTANGVGRSRLAAFSASSGSLLGWAPTADSGVTAVQLTPDGTRVIVAGMFANINGSAALGVASVDASTGASYPFAVNQVVQDYGANSAILSLSTDGTAIYGSAYTHGTPGNFEGIFSVNPTSGAINWLADCHGDSYGTYSSGAEVYVVSHEHDCSNIGGFPDSNPRNVWHRSTAFTTAVTGTVLHNTAPGKGRGDFYGRPSPSLMNWFPDIDAGTYTGQQQGSWSVAGTAQYVVEGGEFLHVNGTAQQGLVRFAVHALAPNRFGPSDLGAISTSAAGGATASVTVTAATSAYDADDQYLTYQLIRDGDAANPIATLTLPTANFWQLAARTPVTLTDSSAAAGAIHTYRIRVLDAGGSYLDSTTVKAMPLTNLALHKPATESSDAAGSSAALAVDGNTDGVLADGSVTQTNADPNSWWQVDLQSTAAVGSIGIWNRTDCCGDRLSDYWVFASANPFNTSLTPAQQAVQPGVWSSHQSTGPSPNVTVAPPAGTQARYLMVQENTAGQNLSLAEVQAFTPGTGYLSVGPSTLTLSAAAGSTGTATVTVAKPGTTAVTITNYVAPKAPFTISPALAVGQVIAPFSSLTETVSYAPAGAGSDTGSISLTSDDGYPPMSVTLNGSTPGGAVDLALNKPATQSSNALGTTAALAVDGNTDGVFADGSVSQTGADPYSSWQVDLQAAGRVDKIAIWNRTDCCGGRLSDYWVFSSATPFTTGLTPAQQATQPGVWSTHQMTAPSPSVTLLVPSGTRARYVMVQENVPTQNLNLAEVLVIGPPLGSDQPPVAAFTPTCTALACSVDASASSDPDGSIAAYAWAFGDGATGSGVTTSHSYASGGTYPVTLTVTDNQGATTSATASVTVAPPGTLVSDAFGRTTTDGWGTADVGGAWKVTGGSSLFATGSGYATMQLSAARANLTATPSPPASTNTVQTIDIAADKIATGNGYYFIVRSRVNATTYYQVKARFLPGGVVHLIGSKVVNGTETLFKEINVAITYTAGTVLRLQVGTADNGTSTTLSGTVWPVGNTQPATQFSQADTEPALQAAGGVGVSGYASGTLTNAPITFSVDNYTVTGT